MMLFLFNNMKIGRYIVNHSLFKFSTDTLNVRIPLKDPVTEKDTDEYIDRY